MSVVQPERLRSATDVEHASASFSRLTLALDASTQAGSAALLDGGVVIREVEALMRGELEERLMPAILGMLGDAGCGLRDIGNVVCGAGPGSFTSLRIAAAIAKGIALGNARNGGGTLLFGVSSLALIVAGTRSPLPEGRYLALLDAMRGERYAALFGVAGDGRVRELSGLPSARIGFAEVGAVSERLGAVAMGPAQALEAAPHARGVGRLLADIKAVGPVSLDRWEPAYGRLAEAQVKWEATHGQVLPRGHS